MSEPNPPPQPYRRRPRYSGKYPRKFEEKYKELHPAENAETIEKVLASGKTPAGTHRPIMVAEILEVLAPRPGDTVIDCTLGYGGHAQEMLTRIRPGGRLLGIDADPIELPKTEARLRGEGLGPEDLTVFRSNYAGLPQAMEKHQMPVANCILADLGVSSMQIDNPSRGFSTKHEGPLDLRLNPQRGQPASHWLAKTTPIALEAALVENDEPHAALLAGKLAGRKFATTTELAQAVRRMIPDRVPDDDRDLSVRRVFQALRIEVNDEFSALDALLRHLPACLAPGGRVAILTFHSGEDRRVKKAFAAALREGVYSEVAREVLRPSPEERHDNPRSTSAKLRWARKS